jgi:hypothetical protein
MVDQFESFFQNTGVDESKFANDVAKAKTFGMKFEETFKPEISSRIEEIKQRSERLNAKEPLVLGLPNGFLYTLVGTAIVYFAWKLILD